MKLKYRVMERFRGKYSIAAMCLVFEVSRSGYMIPFCSSPLYGNSIKPLFLLNKLQIVKRRYIHYARPRFDKLQLHPVAGLGERQLLT